MDIKYTFHTLPVPIACQVPIQMSSVSFLTFPMRGAKGMDVGRERKMIQQVKQGRGAGVGLPHHCLLHIPLLSPKG